MMRTRWLLAALAAASLTACGKSDEDKATETLAATASDTAGTLSTIAAQDPNVPRANELATESADLSQAKNAAEEAGK